MVATGCDGGAAGRDRTRSGALLRRKLLQSDRSYSPFLHLAEGRGWWLLAGGAPPPLTAAASLNKDRMTYPETYVPWATMDTSETKTRLFNCSNGVPRALPSLARQGRLGGGFALPGFAIAARTQIAPTT